MCLKISISLNQEHPARVLLFYKNVERRKRFGNKIKKSQGEKG